MTTHSAQERAARKMWEIERRLSDAAGERPLRTKPTPEQSGGSPLADLISETIDLESQLDGSVELLRRLVDLTQEANAEQKKLLMIRQQHEGERIRILAEIDTENEQARHELESLQDALESLAQPLPVSELARLNEVSHDMAAEARDAAEQLQTSRALLEQATVRQARAHLVVGERLGELEWRVVVAEARLARLRARRVFRILEVLSALARRPWKMFSLMPRLRQALAKLPLPEVPSERPVVGPLPTAGMVAAPAVRGVRPWSYPGLRIAHAGPLRTFQSATPLAPVTEHDWKEGLEVGYDMLLVEPRAGPIDLSNDMVSRFRQQEIPVVLAARTMTHLESDVARSADVIITFDPQIHEAASDHAGAAFPMWPSVDDTIHNPIGWERQPPNEILVVSDHHDLGPDVVTLEPFADRIHTYGKAITGLPSTRHHDQRPVGTDLAEVAKQYLAAYISPRLALSSAAHLQLALELTASGTPVIAPHSPQLDEILGSHYLPADTPAELQQALQQLSDIPTRERFSVAARRHVLTTHTHHHRLEQLLEHLNIPTKPPDRISILLATNRPDHLDHALDNITRQDWPNKELLLILHGQDNFDLDQINQTLTNLPYTTQLIPCPNTWTLGDCLNTGLDHATGTHITKMDDDDHYGPHHLTDIHTALTYSNAHITGKWANVVYLAQRDLTVDWRVDTEESFGTHIPGATMIGSRDLFLQYRFGRVNRGVDSQLWDRMRADGHQLFSTHRFGFIRVRHGVHTYKRDDALFIGASTGYLRRGLDRSVIGV